jgi:hypothetical protein
LEASSLTKIGVNLSAIHNQPSNTQAKTKQAASIVRGFLDMSELPWMTEHLNILGFVDTIYAGIIKYAFSADTCQARLKALEGPCAFNVFIKTNAIFNHQRLKYVDTEIEEILKEDVEIKLLRRHEQMAGLTEDEVQQHILSDLEIQKDIFLHSVETLRALSSEYVFLALQELLRESNIRDCKDPSNLHKRVGLFAIVGLTLEQVLDFEETSRRAKTLDKDTETTLRHLAIVLLSYLQPPSDLSFPKATKLNSTIGKSESSSVGVFMKNSFWFELYKASSGTVASHLLHIVPEDPVQEGPIVPLVPIPPAPVQELIPNGVAPVNPAAVVPPKRSRSKVVKSHIDRRINDMSESFMRMNVRTSLRGNRATTSSDAGRTIEASTIGANSTLDYIRETPGELFYVDTLATDDGNSDYEEWIVPSDRVGERRSGHRLRWPWLQSTRRDEGTVELRPID